MIVFNYQKQFDLEQPTEIVTWVGLVIQHENFKEGEINYIFCSDDYLAEINLKFLKHNTLTDVISFDNSLGKLISGEVFISVDRIKENANTFKVSFNDELHRVMIHGILHYCGYKDKTKEEKLIIRKKEDYYLSLRTFK